jgi:hypothetical protein
MSARVRGASWRRLAPLATRGLLLIQLPKVTRAKR